MGLSLCFDSWWYVIGTGRFLTITVEILAFFAIVLIAVRKKQQ